MNNKKINLQSLLAPMVLVILYVFFSLTGRNFFGVQGAKQILQSCYYIGYMAFGVTFVIITGGIDLSLGTNMMCSALMGGVAFSMWGWPMPLALLFAVVVGVIVEIAVPASTDITDMANAATSLLNTKGLKAVFLSNEGVVSGFLAATSTGADLAEGGIYEDLLVCGFDAGATQKNAIREGWFFGSVTQDPYHIGYYAVEMAVKAARGEEVADKDTGAKWYNAENIDAPEIAELVYD